uniref:Protochlorophyllide reductase n=1 Tax=Heterosigma akashiwo TaxID=2829 RepID=A0A7S4D963_HETAK
MTVDTSSLGSVRNFAMEYLAKHEGASLDMLYLNAGIGGGGHLSEDGFVKLTEDGIEVVFATNYVGHHLLYRLLEPLLLDSKMARVVQVSSAASFNSFKHGVATSLQELNSRDFDPKGMKHYGQSKLAQIVWAKELTRRLGGDSSVYVNACHPGAVNTMIWDKVGLSGLILAVLNFFRGVLMWTSEEGALTQLYLGVAIDRLSNEDVRGKYFHPQAREVVNPLALDTELQRNLWTFSEDLVADFL